MTSDWEAVWADLDRRYTRAKDSQGALAELFRRYRKLDPDGRRSANEVLFASLLQDDEGKRYDALAIINEFRLTEAVGVLQQLAARLRLDKSPSAPFELAKVERFLGKLQSF